MNMLFPQKILNFSVEFFPPQSAAGYAQLLPVVCAWELLHPTFFSITFGAQGGEQLRTVETVQWLREKTSVSLVPHLSCVGMTKKSVEKILQTYHAMEIDRLLVVRGDIFSEKNTIDFHSAVELIRFIRETTGDTFDITVAAHLECEKLFSLQEKIAAGANRAITQYCFDAKTYIDFLEACREMQITIPITPGILLSAQTNILCEALMASGVTTLHFFSMNQSI